MSHTQLCDITYMHCLYKALFYIKIIFKKSYIIATIRTQYSVISPSSCISSTSRIPIIAYLKHIFLVSGSFDYSTKKKQPFMSVGQPWSSWSLFDTLLHRCIASTVFYGVCHRVTSVAVKPHLQLSNGWRPPPVRIPRVCPRHRRVRVPKRRHPRGKSVCCAGPWQRADLRNLPGKVWNSGHFDVLNIQGVHNE